MRYRATLAYDGTAYMGFQKQANAQTVQGVVEEALRRFSGAPVRVIAAGRTDTGVHASGQTIAFDLVWQHGVKSLEAALNHYLPADVAVREVSEAQPGFHPRFDARSRTYVYRLYVSPVRDPLRRNSAWHLTEPFDVAGAGAAASHLTGTHDFAAFGTPPVGENTVRTVWVSRWDSGPVDDEYRFTITANAFLFRMVRRIVSALVAVGQGRVTKTRFVDILSSRRIDPALRLAPACGLTLTAVEYEDVELPAAEADNKESFT
ncbi:MAG: tRNA pseudouridine(38-40) synthase TruA [Anaerolineae bacterium]|nr:tRNA pseudouridine(38-40) synthase TruA [Anaerolineae bacterium]